MYAPSILSLLTASVVCLSAAIAAPTTQSLTARATCASPQPTDAPYDLPCSTLAAAITCPYGISQKSGGIVLLVHGTGSTGAETWGQGPYLVILKKYPYDVCYVTIPGRSLNDVQTNAEYVAYAIQTLAPQSATKKVSAIGHSQGNINIQWTLAFWPSLQSSVSTFIALAADFHGTIGGPIITVTESALAGGAPPAFYQQSTGSKYLAAQNTIANRALVKTVSIYTLTDDIVQPEIIAPTSALPGAQVISTQLVCPLVVVDHFIITVTPPAFYLALSALQNGGTAKLSDALCAYKSTDISDAAVFAQIPFTLKQAFGDALALIENNSATGEPPLKKYVCQRGAATVCSTS